MSQDEFIARWEADKAIYKAWGDYIISQISSCMEREGKQPKEFFKITPTMRLKSSNSMLDKAFNRDKGYENPYSDIEDKVGVRFVVLLLEDINLICQVIQNSGDWSYDASRHFQEDKEREPLLFTYQSVHYVLRPSKELEVDGLKIPMDTPCEVQVRTLLQHAHAELTHDAIYKAKKLVQPEVHRTVAKSMALIETTDEFFKQVTDALNAGPFSEHNIGRKIDSLYESFTGLSPVNYKFSMIVWDAYDGQINENLIGNITSFLNNTDRSVLKDIIIQNYASDPIYQQSIVLFLYWMISDRKRRLLADWPMNNAPVQKLASDLGISLADD